MDYIVNPIAAFLKWTFDYILVPLGELPDIINPNYLFLYIGFIGLFIWLFLLRRYRKKAERENTLL